MAKRKRLRPGKCVHCLSDPVERDWDHVFPESWYPDTTPPNLSKWQVPSCIPCNRALGRIEEDFARRVAMCLDAEAPESAGIVQKMMRSMNPAYGKNERDRKVRAALRQRMIDEMMPGEAIPRQGVYPGLGERWGRPVEERAGISVPGDHFRKLTKKIVRGIFYLEEKKFIEPPYRIEFFAVNAEGASQVRALIDQYGREYAREPGIIVRRAVAVEDGISSVFEIEFWKQFKTHATVLLEELEADVDEHV